MGWKGVFGTSRLGIGKLWDLGGLDQEGSAFRGHEGREAGGSRGGAVAPPSGKILELAGQPHSHRSLREVRQRRHTANINNERPSATKSTELSSRDRSQLSPRNLWARSGNPHCLPGAELAEFYLQGTGSPSPGLAPASPPQHTTPPLGLQTATASHSSQNESESSSTQVMKILMCLLHAWALECPREVFSPLWDSSPHRA
ncbi:hypothetical protein P7K49_040006 [Saguinus oedipus]|uniref:Uncharacterized protein n=1 Tax=Saguinus oedipus TaxID=9490 RepID=A0ABQ9TD24_SAGOE|nr:hypothetical protein P7K49_040006 [Saguinus oedipus]